MEILTSKIHIPVQTPGIIPRQHLKDSLERQVQNSRLVLVTAPAGYGKTTLLADWARSSAMPVAWLSITGEEGDIERFLRYLLAAWKEVQPEIADAPLGIMLGAQSPNIKAVLSSFINTAEKNSDHLAFVLDDYHILEAPEIHEAVAFLLDHLPPNLHFLLTSRSAPPVPLARYRARRQLWEVRAEDLYFTPEETAQFLNGSMGLELSGDEIGSLYEGTEGWAAGLQLAALVYRRQNSLESDRPSISGRHRFIADYLVGDVLNQLPEDLQAFLLKTSILDRMCGPLCDAVTGENGGQEKLELLERENLFIVPMDEHREWFRYHTLFCDFLRGEAKQRMPDALPLLHRRAALWFAENKMDEPTLRHAAAGGDGEFAIRISEPFIHRMLVGGQLKVLEHWFTSLPNHWFAEYPAIGLAQAGYYAMSGAVASVIRSLNDVEHKLGIAEKEDTDTEAKLTAIRCAVACYQNNTQEAEKYALKALEELPKEDHTYRALIYQALGDTYRRIGRWENARERYIQALNLSQDPVSDIRSVHVYGALADLDLRQGRLRDAFANWNRAMQQIRVQKGSGTLPLPVIGWVYIRLGEIQFEWNQLKETREQVFRGLDHAELGGDVSAILAGCLIAGRLELAEGDLAACAGRLERARHLAEQASYPYWSSRYERLQFELQIAQNKRRRAVERANQLVTDDSLHPGAENEDALLAASRVLILEGDRTDVERANKLLREVVKQAEVQGRMGVCIEGNALLGLMHWNRGENPEAMTALEVALRLAEPEGYIRLFVDLGLPMARLLQEARKREVMPEYVQGLLTAFGESFDAVTKIPLPEPLTPREQEILEKIAAGLTNREIAEEFVISPETVKKHTGNIYGKLGVGSRTEAVARARELGLLQ